MSAIKTKQDGNVLVITVEGRFDFTLHRDFREAYRNTKGSEMVYIVDLHAADYMDSSALGMLLLLKEHAGGDKNSVAIRNCKAEICNILKIANFDKLFKVDS